MPNTGRPKKDPSDQLRGSIHVMVREDVKAALQDISADTWRDWFGMIAEMRKAGQPALLFTTKMNDDNNLTFDKVSVINPPGPEPIITIFPKTRGGEIITLTPKNEAKNEPQP